MSGSKKLSSRNVVLRSLASLIVFQKTTVILANEAYTTLDHIALKPLKKEFMRFSQVAAKRYEKGRRGAAS